MDRALTSMAQALTNVAALVRDDEVTAELRSGVLHNKLQLGLAFVLDALKNQRRRKTLKDLAHSGLFKT